MKAYVLHDINKFHLEDVERPCPEENEVLVAVKAAGKTRGDISVNSLQDLRTLPEKTI